MSPWVEAGLLSTAMSSKAFSKLKVPAVVLEPWIWRPL